MYCLAKFCKILMSGFREKVSVTSEKAVPRSISILWLSTHAHTHALYFSATKKNLILVPRGRAPFGQHQESRPLARSNDIPVLNGFENTIDWDQNQSDCHTWYRACAEWREVRESRTSVVGHGQRSRFLVLTKRSRASGDENGKIWELLGSLQDCYT